MLIDGKKVAKEIQEHLAKEIQKYKNRKPGLAFILVGNNPASEAYVRMKKKACAQLGMESYVKILPRYIEEQSLLSEIHTFNHNPLIDGILVQQPLPRQINPQVVINAILPEKDVDGFHPVNIGKLLCGEVDGFVPCTPLGILKLIEFYNIPVEGKHVVIVGRSNIVGKPLAALLVQKRMGCNATVTIAHSRSDNLSTICKQADILVAAIGKPGFIQKEMVKEKSVVIDVGISRMTSSVGNPILVGDVDFEEVSKVAAAITPVPGGVGPMTIAMLMQNTLTSFQRKESR